MAKKSKKTLSTKAQFKIEVGTIYDHLLDVMVQRTSVDKYTLSHAADEYLAFLGGDPAAASYLGFSVDRGATLLENLKSLDGRLQALIDKLED